MKLHDARRQKPEARIGKSAAFHAARKHARANVGNSARRTFARIG